MAEITVVITAHNLEQYLENCLKDLEFQTFRDFEILVVNDCSTDGTADIISRYAEQHPDRVRWFSTPANLRYVGLVRNAALDSGLISGKYVIFLDGDDRMNPRFLEKLYRAAEEQNADIALCAYERVVQTTGHILSREMTNFPPLVFPRLDSAMLPFMNGSVWNKLIRFERIGSSRFPEIKVGEDVIFSLRLYSCCEKIVILDEILFSYYVRGNSLIGNAQESDAYRLAEQFSALEAMRPLPEFTEALKLAAFIHVGISMPMRIYENDRTHIVRLLTWIDRWFSKQYGWFQNAKYFKTSFLLRHKIQGLGIAMAKSCYRLHCFRLFLQVYHLFVSTLNLDIKF